MEHFGKYQLIRKLATGGMAEVFLAKAAGPMGFEKILVVKRILPHLAEDPAFVQRFLAEAKLAARLDHPNVVQIFDLGEHAGGYFIAMEYIDGPSLRTVCRKLEKSQLALPPAFCAKVISMACEGLAYAHDFRDPETGKWLGIIHRDISPENVLVSRNGSVKVVDFGLAKAAAVSETKSRILFGKYWYMAPEQLRRKDKLDRRVDVYALGVVLYELLTSGRKPFDATGEMEMMRAILSEQYVPASRRRKDVPPALDRILEKALGKKEQRYPDCRQLQVDLERFILQSGTPMGTQQITRIITELGVMPQGISGQHASPAAAAQGGIEETRATPSIASLERGEAALTRATPSVEAAELGDSSAPVRTGTGETRLLDVAAARDGETRLVGVAARGRVADGLDQDGETRPDLQLSGETRLLDYRGVGDNETRVLDTRDSEQMDVTQLDRELPRFDERGSAELEPPPSGSVHTLTTLPAARRLPRLRARGPLLAVTVGVLLLAGGGAAGFYLWRGRGAGGPALEIDASEPVVMEAPAAAPTLARVRLVSEPPADIRVDGRPVGRSPVELSDLQPGMIRVEISDRRLGFRKEQRLELTPGDNGTRSMVVQLLPVELRIRPRAHVSVDDREMGDTSGVKIQLFEGWHKIRLINRSLDKDVVKDFIVLPGQANVFTFDLRH